VQNRLSRLSRDWERRGYVRHIVLQGPALGEVSEAPRVPDLERQIEGVFGLRRVVVADRSSLAQLDAAGRAVPGEAAMRQADNRVHKLLGATAARLLVSILRTGDSLGVGSGRGSYYTAHALSRLQSAPLVSLRSVVSLMGALVTRNWSEWSVRDAGGADSQSAVNMDADSIGALLCRLLHAGAQVRVNRSVSSPLNGDVRDQWIEAVKSTNVALVGLGAVTGKSHFVPEGAVRDELDVLAKKAFALEEGNQGYQRLIGELCGSLFVTTGSQLPFILKRDTSELQQAVREINAKLCNTPPECLADVCRRGAVVAVTGGAYKAAALSHVLNQYPPWVSHLVIDDELALELLRMKRET
jgi:DNA-binding transcriptional regulator LsrR (DeoR family)